MITKICTVCKVEKELQMFNKNSKLKDGRTVRCKKCKNKYNRGWASKPENKLKKKIYAGEHMAESRVHKKRWEENNKDKVKASVMKRREKNNALHRAWYANNKERAKTIKTNYKHKRRTIENNGMSTIELMTWKNEQNKVCYWCNTECENNHHIDHYFPLSKGGKHEAENLVISCPTCNVRKNAKDPLVFAQERGRLL